MVDVVFKAGRYIAGIAEGLTFRTNQITPTPTSRHTHTVRKYLRDCGPCVTAVFTDKTSSMDPRQAGQAEILFTLTTAHLEPLMVRLTPCSESTAFSHGRV